MTWLERPLARIGKLDQLSVVVATVALVLSAQLLANDEGTVMIAGAFGLVAYILVNGLGSLGSLFEEASEDEDEDEEPATAGRNVRFATGKAAFFLFMYLEVLDASFSFDGVIGAFAITQDIILIAVGLGVGAFYIRSLTVYLVRKGMLSEYVFLEHGAHWAIGALAVILLSTIKYEIPDVVTGSVDVVLIALAFASSKLRRSRGADATTEVVAIGA